MFAGKSSIANICKIHFQTLQVSYNNYDKSHHDLLNFSNDVSIHQRHLRFRAIEVYKPLKNMNPESCGNFSVKIQFSTIYEKKIHIICHLPYPLVMEVIPWLSGEAYSGIVFPVM